MYFLPYVTNTLAVGLVFMILFKKTAYSEGLVNLLIELHSAARAVDFIDGPYCRKDVRDVLLYDLGRAAVQDSDSDQRACQRKSGLL